MYELKHIYSRFFKTIVLVVVCLFLVNTIAWAYPPDRTTLATQSSFNPITGNRIRDIGIIKYYLHCLAKVFHDDLTSIKRDVNTRITSANVGVILGFSSTLTHNTTSLLTGKIPGECLVPCKVAGTLYYAYITPSGSPGEPDITVFTEVQYDRIEQGIDPIVHEMRTETDKEEKDIEHEEKQDTPLSIIHGEEKDRIKAIVDLENDPIRDTVLDFFRALGARNDFIEEAETFMKGSNVTIVPKTSSIVLEVDGKEYHFDIEIETAHASNSHINIPDFTYDDIRKVLIHELSAKCGNPDDFNEKLESVYERWRTLREFGKEGTVDWPEEHADIAAVVGDMGFKDLAEVAARDMHSDEQTKDKDHLQEQIATFLSQDFALLAFNIYLGQKNIDEITAERKAVLEKAASISPILHGYLEQMIPKDPGVVEDNDAYETIVRATLELNREFLSTDDMGLYIYVAKRNGKLFLCPHKIVEKRAYEVDNTRDEEVWYLEALVEGVASGHSGFWFPGEKHICICRWAAQSHMSSIARALRGEEYYELQDEKAGFGHLEDLVRETVEREFGPISAMPELMQDLLELRVLLHEFKHKECDINGSRKRMREIKNGNVTYESLAYLTSMALTPLTYWELFALLRKVRNTDPSSASDAAAIFIFTGLTQILDLNVECKDQEDAIQVYKRLLRIDKRLIRRAALMMYQGLAEMVGAGEIDEGAVGAVLEHAAEDIKSYEIQAAAYPTGPGGDTPFIGKWQPVSEVEFVPDNFRSDTGTLTFLAKNMKKPKKGPVEIELRAERAPPDEGIFEKHSGTSIPEVEGLLVQTLENIPQENRFLIQPNKYGIKGIGTQDVLAVEESLKDKGLAIFHEVAHAAMAGGLMHLEWDDDHRTITLKARWSPKQEFVEIRSFKISEDEKRVFIDQENWADGWDKNPHYLLRVLQMVLFPGEDYELTGVISGRTEYPTRDIALTASRYPRSPDRIFYGIAIVIINIFIWICYFPPFIPLADLPYYLYQTGNLRTRLDVVRKAVKRGGSDADYFMQRVEGETFNRRSFRLAAIEGLKASDGPRAVTTLCWYVDCTKDPMVQREAAKALEEVDDEALLGAIEGIRERRVGGRKTLLATFIKRGELNALLGALSDRDPVLRKEVAYVLGASDPENKPIISSLTAALEDEDPGVHRAAKRALEEIRDKKPDLVMLKTRQRFAGYSEWQVKLFAAGYELSDVLKMKFGEFIEAHGKDQSPREIRDRKIGLGLIWAGTLVAATTGATVSLYALFTLGLLSAVSPAVIGIILVSVFVPSLAANVLTHAFWNLVLSPLLKLAPLRRPVTQTFEGFLKEVFDPIPRGMLGICVGADYVITGEETVSHRSRVPKGFFTRFRGRNLRFVDDPNHGFMGIITENNEIVECIYMENGVSTIMNRAKASGRTPGWLDIAEFLKGNENIRPRADGSSYIVRRVDDNGRVNVKRFGPGPDYLYLMTSREMRPFVETGEAVYAVGELFAVSDEMVVLLWSKCYSIGEEIDIDEPDRYFMGERICSGECLKVYSLKNGEVTDITHVVKNVGPALFVEPATGEARELTDNEHKALNPTLAGLVFGESPIAPLSEEETKDLIGSENYGRVTAERGPPSVYVIDDDKLEKALPEEYQYLAEGLVTHAGTWRGDPSGEKHANLFIPRSHYETLRSPENGDLLQFWRDHEVGHLSDRDGVITLDETEKALAKRMIECKIDRMPAGELLFALGLRDLEHIPGAKLVIERDEGSYMVRRIEVTKPFKIGKPEGGVSILQRELTDPEEFWTTEFDLIYSKKTGHLIAVFPIIPEGEEEKLWRVSYFDLSYYYFEVPDVKDPGAKDKWVRFAERRMEDAKLIESYKKGKYKGLPTSKVSRVGESQAPYCYLSVKGDMEEGWSPVEIDLDEPGKLVLPDPAEGEDQIIVPVFPTVYSLATWMHGEADKGYYNTFYRDMDLREGLDVLTVGPGTGCDVWLSWLRSKNKMYAIGYNPLEIANLEATAEIAGFEVEAKVGDNIVDEDGRPRFGEKKFDRVTWNMPAYAKAYEPAHLERDVRSFADVWDGDLGGLVLKQFASGLPIVLKPGHEGGLSKIWNVGEYHPDVENILENGGGDDPWLKLLDVEWKRPGYIVTVPAAAGEGGVEAIAGKVTEAEAKAAARVFSKDPEKIRESLGIRFGEEQIVRERVEEDRIFRDVIVLDERSVKLINRIVLRNAAGVEYSFYEHSVEWFPEEKKLVYREDKEGSETKGLVMLDQLYVETGLDDVPTTVREKYLKYEYQGPDAWMEIARIAGKPVVVMNDPAIAYFREKGFNVARREEKPHLAMGGLGAVAGSEIVKEREKRKAVLLPEGVAGDLDEMPAGELLTALGLRDFQNIPGADILGESKEDGYIRRRIRVAEPLDLSEPPKGGVSILQRECADPTKLDLREFDLIYNDKGYLIAVFPVLPMDVAKELAAPSGPSKELVREIMGLEPRYLDLSYYYFKVPSMGDPLLREKWKEFTEERKKDKHLIKKYKEKTFGKALAPKIVRVGHDQAPYVYLSVKGDMETSWFPREIDPDVTDAGRIPKPEEGVDQIIIPVFPTVYSPAASDHQGADHDYYNGFYETTLMQSGHEVLVGGPGSGVDAWLAWRKTGNEIYSVGYNPLEVASLRVTAKIAGFGVEAIVGDNIIAKDGTPCFPGKKFDRLIWNMPSYTSRTDDTHQFGIRSLTDAWDHDKGGRVLRRCARGIPVVLKPEGLARLWNRYYYHPKVETILEKAGQDDSRHRPLRVDWKYHGYSVRLVDERKEMRDPLRIAPEVLMEPGKDEEIRTALYLEENEEDIFNSRAERDRLFHDSIVCRSDSLIMTTRIISIDEEGEENFIYEKQIEWIPADGKLICRWIEKRNMGRHYDAPDPEISVDERTGNKHRLNFSEEVVYTGADAGVKIGRDEDGMPFLVTSDHAMEYFLDHGFDVATRVDKPHLAMGGWGAFSGSQITAVPTDDDRAHMAELVEIAKRKVESGELDPKLPVVARIVDGAGNVVVTSFRKKLDKPSKYGVKAVHAEIQAIRDAENKGFSDWENATMYTNLSSCHNCNKALTEFYGFKRIIYGIPDQSLLAEEIARNAATCAANNVELVGCDDELIIKELRWLFREQLGGERRSLRSARNNRMMDLEKRITERHRKEYQKRHGEDIQVCVLDADLWGEKVEEETLLRHLEWLKQDLNPGKKHVVLLLGEETNCVKARERIIKDGIFENKDIQIYGPEDRISQRSDKDASKSHPKEGGNPADHLMTVGKELQGDEGYTVTEYMDKDPSGMSRSTVYRDLYENEARGYLQEGDYEYRRGKRFYVTEEGRKRIELIDEFENKVGEVAREFKRALFNLGLNHDNGEYYLLALDEDCGREGTSVLVRKLIKDICETTNDEELKTILQKIIIIRKRGEDLAKEVIEYTGKGKKAKDKGMVKVKKSNVIMITRSSNLINCLPFWHEAIITAIDDSELDMMDYYPFLEIALFTIAKVLYYRDVEGYGQEKLKSLYRSINAEAIDEDEIISRCVDANVVDLVLKPVEPFALDELQHFYRCIHKFLKAA